MVLTPADAGHPGRRAAGVRTRTALIAGMMEVWFPVTSGGATAMTASQLDRDEPDTAEQRLRHAAATGTLVDLRTGERDDPAAGAGWGAERTVHADALIDLLTGQRPRAVKLRGARVTGELDLEAAELACPLLLADCHIEQPVNLREATAPAIRLPGCHLPGLTADQVRTTGDLNLDGIIVGTVGLAGARIGGRLSFVGARLSSPGGRALTGDGLLVEHDLDGRDGFTAEGEIRLVGAHIGGTLSLGGAGLTNTGGYALRLDRATVDQDVFFETGFTAHGEVHMGGVHIRGLLALTGARFANPGGRALNAYLLTVDQDMAGQDGFVVDGEFRLLRASIGGGLSLEGARLTNPDAVAMHAAGLAVGQDMSCRNLTAEGEVRLQGARIGGVLSLDGAALTRPRHLALDLAGLDARVLVLRPRGRPDGGVDLTNAHVGIYDDDPATWPASMPLRGFTYDSLGLRGDRADARARLRWLAREPGGYVPQLYDQLAAVYLRAGDEQAVRRVAVAKQWRRRAVQGPTGKPANWLLYLTVGYGYRTWLAAVWLAGLLALGTWIFTDAPMTRVDPHAPGFNALGYTLDVLVPIVDLGQQKAWQAHGAAMYWSWAFMAAGWILTTAVVAGLTGILKRG
jgi:hypothetical protein